MVTALYDTKRQVGIFSNLPYKNKKIVKYDQKVVFNLNPYIIQLKSKDRLKEVDDFIEYECI